jgi:superfamily II DNA or RNA helicase
MNAQPLRPYQAEAVTALRLSLAAGHRRVLLQLATGAGKTRIAAEICRMADAKRKRVLFLAPRRELITQAAAAFAGQGLFPGIIMAGEPQKRLMDLQVASFDTLHARAVRTGRMEMPAADLVIVDEAHLSLAETRKDIIEHYGEACVIGLTATPARGDGRGLGEIYDDLVMGPSIRHLTDEGHLVPLRYFAPTAPDLAALKLNRDGDYVEAGLAERMDRPQLVGDIVGNWLRIAQSRLTVVFCVNRAHSRHVCQAFLDAGVRAEHLDGETPNDERAAILDRVRSGETQVLCNVFVASYGLDIPALDCAVLARPTKNIALYLQTIGRVMRPSNGKHDALVIDHSGAVKENGFVDDFIPWSLDASESVKDRKERQQKESAEPKEIECPSCHYVFKARRECPACGHMAIRKGEAIPVHEAELKEIRREAGKANREFTWEEKRQFIAGLRAYAKEHGYNPGWVAHKYRTRFGVWPNDARVKDVPPQPYSEEVRRWLKSQQIRYAKRRAA